MQPFVTVIIVNYNSGARLQKCLASLQAQSFKDFDVKVVDNASHDGSADKLPKLSFGLSLDKQSENHGFAKANNMAARKAKGAWLAFLNPDAYPKADWLEEFAKAAQKYPDALAFGSAQICDDDPDKLDGAGDAFHIMGLAYRGYYQWDIGALPADSEVFAPCAAAAFYKAETFAALGGFDERFFCYGEDVDLGYRLRLMGGKTIQLSKAAVSHEGSAISGRHSDFTIYHGHRNRIWLTYKNTPFWLYWPFIPLHIAAHLMLLVKAPFHGTARPYLKALIHGYAGLGKLSKDRGRIQAARKVSYLSLAKVMSWSPLSIISRKGKNIALPDTSD